MLGIAALAGFLISLVVHVESLRGVDVAAYVPEIWLLHVGIFIVFFPFVLLSRKESAGSPSLFGVARGLPRWAIILGGMIFVYALVNFGLFMLHSEGGNPGVENGKYVLMEHGRLTRELTAAEFTAFKANEARGFSGHWMLFYFVAAAYFLFRKPAVPALSSGRADRTV